MAHSRSRQNDTGTRLNHFTSKSKRASGSIKPFVRARYSLIACLLLTLAHTAFSEAGSSLRTIDNPGGGNAVYGPVENASTLREAMGVMLRYVHERFGDRPVIGKFSQSRGKGPMTASIRLGPMREGPQGGWALGISGAEVPKQLADEEWPTIKP